MEAALEDYDHNLSNDIWNFDPGDPYSHNSSDYETEINSGYSFNVMSIYIFILCILGVAGNGTVLWLLGFRVQRNPSMTYILNLALADLGVLISVILLYNPFKWFSFSELENAVISFVALLTYSASQFLLTAISFDRCMAIFFPLWHRCHWPPRLSALVCALTWVLPFLLAIVTFTAIYFDEKNLQLTQFIVNAVLCLPLMTISTLALFIKVCFKPRQHRQRKLLTILFLTFPFFLLCAFPFNVIFIFYMYGYVPAYFRVGSILIGYLNFSVKPVIYFLVGRQRKTWHRQSLKMILQRAFKEEEEEEEEEDGHTEEAPAETRL